jgi:protein-arginine deiminase
VWAVSVGSNQSMINVFESALGNRFIAITGVQDPWIQDELEWATATGEGQRLNIAMDSIRDRQLDAWVKGLKAPDTEPMTWGTPGTATSEDKFGNLEATPPHTAGGIEYPFGRIYYGRGASCEPNATLRNFLASQVIQDPIEIDTCWLCVGHVDEFLSFVPDPSSAKGFKFLISDVDAAYSILGSMPSGTSLPRYQDSHGYSSVGAIVNDNSLRALNEDIQRDYIDPVREQIKSELDLDDTDIIRLPALFERIQCPYKYDGVVAMIPALLNLVVVNFEGEPLRIFVSDPFMRSNTGDQSSDPVIADFRDKMPDDYEIYFVDDWYTYHVMIGEVHCGTNVQRTPTERWWEVGMHLLGGG